LHIINHAISIVNVWDNYIMHYISTKAEKCKAMKSPYQFAGHIKSPVAVSVKIRAQFQKEIATLPHDKREQLNILFEDMAIASYDMGVEE